MQGFMERVAKYLNDIDNRTRRIEQTTAAIAAGRGAYERSGTVSEMFKDVLEDRQRRENPPVVNPEPVVVTPDPKVQIEQARKRLEKMRGVEKPVKKKLSFWAFLWWRITGRRKDD